MASKFQKNKALTGLIIAGAVGLVGFGIVRLLRKKSKHEEEELQFPSRSNGTTTTPSTESTTPQIVTIDNTLEKLAQELMDNYTKKEFSELGVTIQVPKGWEAAIDEGRGDPVIRVIPPGMDRAPPGEVPTITIVVEDVSRDELSLLEYKERCQSIASLPFQTPPNVTKDEPIQLGPFRHILEYNQMIPMAFAPFKFMNLLTVKNGNAYLFQCMARSDKFQEFQDEVHKLAKTLVIEELPERKPSRIEYLNAPYKLKCSLPETWIVVKETRGASDLPQAGGKLNIATFKSGSIIKPDMVLLCKLVQPSNSAQELSEACAKIYKNSGEISSINESVSFFKCKVDEINANVYCSKDYFLEVKPDSDSTKVPSVSAEVIKSILGSISGLDKDIETSKVRYFNNHFRFSFQMAQNSRLLEHKFGGTALSYCPIYVDETSEQPVPTFTVDINKEPEPCTSLKALEERIMGELDPSTPAKEKSIIKINGKEYLTFIVSHIEQDPYGVREEIKSKIVITLRGEETVLLKWTVVANEWIRYERYMNPLIDSFELYE